MSKQQVIFVETQGDILSRLRSELTASRRDWHILQVADAAAGLELLSQRKVGLLLANFGMDKTGCEEFFRTVKDVAPEIIRMGMLSDSYKDSLPNSPELAHQCVAAHCDSFQIEALISRGLSAWEQTRANHRLAEFLSNLQTLPTPPALYFDIRDELESPSGSARSIAEIIARDPAITAKLLKVANSGFYANPRTIADLYEAITLLGIDLVLALVLTAHLYDQLPLPGLNLDVLWKHSMAVATLAKAIAAEEGASRATASTCAIAGLLHDIGGLIFLTDVPDPYYTIVRRCGGNERQLLHLEMEEFGVGHHELGALILSLWGLPKDVVQAIAEHHTEDPLSVKDIALPSKAVCVAEWLLDTSGPEGDVKTPNASDVAAALHTLLQQFTEQGVIHQHDYLGALFR